MRATSDRVIVAPVKEAEKGGVIIPDMAMEKPQRGEVRVIGPKVEEGLNTGDVVLYSKYGGTPVEVDGEELVVLREADILAVL